MNSISKIELPWSDLFARWWADFRLRYYFKFVLPRINSTTVDGIRLDLTPFSPRIRNRILLGYEEAEKRICREFLSPQDSVLEIGAAIGFIGLFCTKRLGIKRYVSVEANPHTIKILRRNYQINNATPEVWNFALGSHDGAVDLCVDGDFWEHSINHVNKPKQRISVTSASLQSLLNRAADANALIIDIEGAEQFINFAQLPSRVTKVIIELHPQVIGQQRVRNILECLTGSGFKIVHQQEDTLAFHRNAKPERNI